MAHSPHPPPPRQTPPGTSFNRGEARAGSRDIPRSKFLAFLAVRYYSSEHG